MLGEHRGTIVSHFVAEARYEDSPPPGVSRAGLVDHIPRFLDAIAAELLRMKSGERSEESVDVSDSARQHGEQRWELGYDLRALVSEYGILRHCILRVAKDVGASVTIDDFDILAKCLSVGVTEAVTAYSQFRDEELNAQKAVLEFLTEAGQVLTSSLDYRSTLTRLTRLIVPRLADWCAVHMDGTAAADMPIAHVEPDKVAVLRQLYERYPAAEDAHGYPYVTRMRDAELVPRVDRAALDVQARDAEHLTLMHQINSVSWLSVPLRVQDSLFGALTFGYSVSGREYAPKDAVLAEELARRAAVAIDNARLYESSQRERTRLESATRAKDEFVAMVSHELRTPLNAILGWLRLIRGGSLAPSKVEHAIEVIERNANAQNQLVTELLDISRVITGKIRINLSPVDIRNVVEMALEGVRPAADAKRIQIETSLDVTGLVIRGDSDRLSQVVWNLLANAVKFTAKGGFIRVSTRRVDSDVELAVEDNGVGIASDFLPHVFESFRQSDTTTARSFGGLGIGLSIAKHLVELHGGSIEPHSEGLGKGARFVVRLPVSPIAPVTPSQHGVPAASFQATTTAFPIDLHGATVLVVDDDPDARELLGYVLEMCGVEVHTAGSAADAVTQLQTYTPQVIISDIGMPDEDGYALIRRIRTLPLQEKKDIPAIALTAFARNEDRTRALVEGFNMHIAKPVEPIALVRAIVDLVGHTRRGGTAS